jgi:hypothetical protein
MPELGGLSGCFKDRKPEVALKVDLSATHRDYADRQVHMMAVPPSDHHIRLSRHAGVDCVLGKAQAINGVLR